ncbi:hypothetical protein RvVAT039_pl02510 (plasmid) [Agrobacterium vitis]|nr:hypothetical protein RvVAT039_pl02510 [Agrobacterium vitis]
MGIDKEVAFEIAQTFLQLAGYPLALEHRTENRFPLFGPMPKPTLIP